MMRLNDTGEQNCKKLLKLELEINNLLKIALYKDLHLQKK